MATEELKEFVEARLRAYDPDVDLNEGSPAQDLVVDPIVRRFTPDPFEMDVETYISTLLAQKYPSMNFREGSMLRDAVVKPMQALLDPIAREAQIIKQSQSLANPELLAPSEADALVANIFVSRTTGGLSVGTARLYFNAPVALSISVGNVCYTAGGLRFIPTTLQSISAESMIFNQSGNLYYFDIQLTAEAAGEEYNVSRGEIIGITNLNTAVKVENLEKFSGGLPEEDTESLVSKAETSITERSLVVPRGASARLRDQFEDLVHLQVVGYGDSEMQRDVITGGDLGPALLSNNDGYTEDDGDGDAYTDVLSAKYTDFSAFFSSVGGLSNHKVLVTEINYGNDGEVPVLNLNRFRTNSIDFDSDDVGSTLLSFGADPSNVGMAQITAVLDIAGSTWAVLDRTGVTESNISWVLVRPEKEYDILSVIGGSAIRVDGQLRVDRQAMSWAIHQKLLRLSDIPGGILFSADAAAIEIQSDEIHIGGASDLYVRGTEIEEAELAVSAISDESPVVRSLKGETNVADDEFFRDATKDFSALGIKVGWSVVVETGLDAGTKRILAVGKDPSGADDGTYLQIDPPVTSTAADLRYKIVDDIDINLKEPKTVRGEGDDLQTIQLSTVYTTAAAVDFVALGTEVGDTLEITEGLDKSASTIESISGTGNKNLIASHTALETNTNLSWRVYRAQDGLSFPLVRIRSIDILDSSGQPTGDTIPFADPVDSQATAFSNAGRGTKVSTSDAVTGIVGTVDLDTLTYPLPATTINVKVNDGTAQPIVLTAATSKTDVINKINAVVPNIAAVLDVDGEERLTIRSFDRWLKIVAAADNANVGLAVAGEDNRQIKSLGNITNWASSSYGLTAARDIVSITTGDNVGQLYLVAVESGRILAVAFDEDAKTVKFLQPNTNVSVSVGSRSYGTARVYFLDPTSFEVRGNWRPALKKSGTPTTPVSGGKLANRAVFAAPSSSDAILVDEDDVTYFTATVNGAELRFVPDPELNHVVLPATSEDVPNNLYTNSAGPNPERVSTQAPGEPAGDLGKNSRDADVDFLGREIHIGDLLEITYVPIQGTVDVSTAGGIVTYPGDLAGVTLRMAIDGGPAKTMTFSDQVGDENDLVDEINTYFGSDIAFLETIGAVKHLRFEADFAMTVFKDGTVNSVVGLPTGSNTTNKAPADIDGYYTVLNIGSPADPTVRDMLVVSPTPTSSGQAQHFKVLRPGVQRISSTNMNNQQETGLYYVDIELVSIGAGDQWNLPAGTAFVITGYSSDGYRLAVLDSNLTYSIEEDLNLTLSRRIITVGSTDRPDQATQLSGQNIQINYDRSPLTASIQSFASSELERVLNASLLVRHLQPRYINFSLTYRGGSGADVVEQDILAYLNGLTPDERVESSDIQDLARRRGATYVANPLTLVAIAHDSARNISVARSQDYVTKGRLETFFVNDITISRETVAAL